MQVAEGTGPQNLVINVVGMLLFAGLFFNEQSAADRRVEQRRELRQAQIRQGDREVYFNEQGQTMSKLKEVIEGGLGQQLREPSRFEDKAEMNRIIVQQQALSSQFSFFFIPYD